LFDCMLFGLSRLRCDRFAFPSQVQRGRRLVRWSRSHNRGPKEKERVRVSSHANRKHTSRGIMLSVRACSTLLLVLVGAVSAIEDRCNACLAVAAELDASIKKDYMSDDRLNILKGGRLDSKVSARHLCKASLSPWAATGQTERPNGYLSN
jgi:hypothetical protein